VLVSVDPVCRDGLGGGTDEGQVRAVAVHSWSCEHYSCSAGVRPGCVYEGLVVGY